MSNFEIYEHNVEAYGNVVEHFKKSNRTCVIHPTGTGKSFIAAQLVRDNPNKKILYLTSYKAILDQFDRTVKKVNNSVNNTRMDIYMNLEKVYNEKQKYDYIILDEFHRCGADAWNEWLNKLLKSNPRAKILGLSATPIRHLDDERDMAEELFRSDIASEMSLASAMERGLLPVPTYIPCMYSLAEVYEKLKNRVDNFKGRKSIRVKELLRQAKRKLELSVGLEDIFYENMKDKNGKYIVFCSSKEHLDSMYTEIDKWLSKVNTKIVKYVVYDDLVNNSETIVKFEQDNSDSLKLLFVINMLNEGVHVNNLSGIIMMRPTQSFNVFMQQIGRALTVDESNRAPIIFDVVNNASAFHHQRAFLEQVQSIVRKSNDKIALEDEFKLLAIVRDLMDIYLSIEDELGNMSWDEMYARVLALYKENGYLGVAKSEDPAISYWLAAQRKLYKKGRLSVERIIKLNAIDMEWDSEHTYIWNKGYYHAKLYAQEHGNLDVPFSYKCDDDYRLGRFLQAQRTRYRIKHKGLVDLKFTPMTDSEERKLTELGMIWETRQERQLADFEWRAKEARDIVDEKGKIIGKFSDGKSASEWARYARRSIERGNMPAEKYEILERYNLYDIIMNK